MLRWPWVVAPTLYVLAAGALAQALGPLRYLVFGVLVLLGVAGLHLLTELRRVEEPPARPAWSFAPPGRLASARVGRAFASAAVVVLPATSVPLLAVAAVLPLVVGVQLIVPLVRRRPALRLSASGIEIGGRRYAWERIAAVELNGDRANPRLDVVLHGRRQPLALRPSGVDASLLFLLDLLGYYHARPSARAFIGSPEEAARVHGLLLHARLAAGLFGGPRPIAVGS